CVLCVVLLVFGVGVVAIQQKFGLTQFDMDLAALNATTASVLKGELEESHDLRHAALETYGSVNVPGRMVAILDASGTPVAARWRGLHDNSLPPIANAPPF